MGDEDDMMVNMEFPKIKICLKLEWGLHCREHHALIRTKGAIKLDLFNCKGIPNHILPLNLRKKMMTANVKFLIIARRHITW